MVRRKVTKQSESFAAAADDHLPRIVAVRGHRTLANFEASKALGVEFLSSAVTAIEAHTETLAFKTAVQRAAALRDMLGFLASGSAPGLDEVRRAIQANAAGQLSAKLAHSAEIAYRDLLTKRYRLGSGSLNAALANTNLALGCLASRGLWPHTLGLGNAPVNRELVEPRPTLLEGLGSTGTQTTDLRGVKVRKEAARRGLERLGLSTPCDESGVAAVLLEGERKCLAALTGAARSILDSNYAAWSEMQTCIASACATEQGRLEAWFQEFSTLPHEPDKQLALRKRTKELFEPNRAGLSSFLALLHLCYMQGNDSWFNHVPESNRQRVNCALSDIASLVIPAIPRLHGPALIPIKALRGLLTPNKWAVSSAATLVLLETGINPSTLLSLPWSQILPTDDPKWISIANWKGRADGALIAEELPISGTGEPTSAASALMKLREMSARRQQFIGAQTESNSLVFDVLTGYASETGMPRTKSISEGIFRTDFKEFALLAFSRSPTPAPTSVRPSLLLKLQGTTGSVRKTQRAAAHKSEDTTTGSYTGSRREATNAAQNQEIRTFLERMEQIALFNLNPEGYNDPQSLKGGVLDQAIRNGLGTLCLRKIPAPANTDAPDCAQIEDCPNCSRIKISTQPEDLADLLAFGEHLAASESWLQTHRPEAWLQRWMFWSILIDEVVTRGARSLWAPNLRRAHDINKTRPRLCFPPLW